MIKKTIIRVIPAALLVALSAFLLRGDVWTFWTWYLLAAVLLGMFHSTNYWDFVRYYEVTG